MSLIIFTIGGLFAAIVAIAATMLASRMNRSQPILEEYEILQASRSSKKFVPRRYPVEINA